MQTFLRPRRWVVGPPLPAWLSAITRLLQPAALTPVLARVATPFAFLLLLLGALAIRPQAALAFPVAGAVSATTGIQNKAYPIPTFTATVDVLNTISSYRFETLPAAAAGVVAYPTNTNGTTAGGYTLAATGVSITPAQAAAMQFTPVAGAAQGTASFTYTVLESVGGRSQTAATYSILMAVADAQTSPVLSNSTGQKAIPTLTATSGTASPTNYRILTLPSTGTLYVNGTAATANLLITAAQAAQLTFAATAGYFGTTSFTYAPADASGDVGDGATYAIPVTTAVCGNNNNSVLDFSRRTVGEDWTNHASVAVNASNITSGNYTASGTSANSFMVDNNTALPGPSLAWRQVNTGFDPATSPNTSTVTFTFDKPVTNLSLSIQDIDQNITATQAFTDALTLDGYSTAGSTTPIALTAANFALGNTNTFSGSNTVTGTGNSSVDPAGNIVVTFTSPVQRLTLTFKNIAPYTSATINRTHTMGITSMTWCRLAPVANNVTTATLPSTAGQVGISPLSSTVDGTVSTYTIVTIPNATTQGTLYYNSTGTTYAAVTAGRTLTAAQAASLRFAPVSAASGNTTFTYTVQDNNGQSSNTATYTIPVNNTPCATATGTFAFSGRPAGEDWKAHAAVPAPAGSGFTTVSTSGYGTQGPITTNTLSVGTFNGVQTLAWSTDYSSLSTNTSTVTFTFNRAVSNFAVQVQDIDTGTGFLDQVVFTGANSGTAVTPVLGPVAGTTSTNTVAINGNTATGTVTNTSATTATVVAYFPSPITTLTLTYSNISTTQADPANNIIGIDLLQFCRLAPVANDVTTPTLLSSVGAASIISLASTVDGTAASYTLTSIPNASTQGVLSYNSSGTTYTNITAANQVLTAAQAASLRFTPVAGSSGNVTFGYKVTDDAGLVSANTATYTIPVSNATCAATGTLNFATQTVGDDWKAHTATPAPANSTITTISSSNYATPASATTSTLSVTSATATTNINGVQTLAWLTDYASQTANTSSVTFTFNRPVSNFAVRVQDIDKAETTDGNGNITNAFDDRVTFVGANGTTTVLPSLAAVGTANTVLITGNVATGTTNITNTTDGTVMAYFASPITSLTLTYSNISTYAADPTNNAIGIDLMQFCRTTPVASNITNTSRPSGQGATAINSLSATADGAIASYTITALPPASQGTFYVNGVALTASTLTLTPAQAAQLTFAPAAGFSGNAGFSYYATDDAGLVSNTATYTVPVTNTGAAGTPAACATPGKDGSPTLSTNPNTYYPATANANATATSITVGAGTTGGAAAATTISKGDLLLVIQMQGADIDYTNTDSYGDGVTGGGASGNLTTNFQAGTYEYVVATNATPINVTAGGIINLASALVNSYVNSAASTTAGPRRFQVVRIPQYGNLTLGGTLTALPWNGSVGGILAIDVAGQTNFSGNTIDASGRGFRGGGGRTQATAAGTATDYVNVAGADAHAQKGEGTAGTPRYVNVPTTTNDATTNVTTDLTTVGYPGGTNGRGAPGNAGGGGNNNINNSGGGGGANGGSGGRGGNNFGDNQAIGGEPGTNFGVVSSSRLVLGGGGGAGTTNNNTGTPGAGFASSGASGGGIVLLRTGTVTGSGTILANGGNANNSVADDGSGGGGAGGTILVTANNTAGLANLTLTANGGKGGTNTGASSGPHGPGGGGGGGVVLTNGSVASALAAAGANGTTQGTPAAFGSTTGTAGVANTQISNSIAGSTVGTTCAADVTTAITGPATLTPAQPSGTYTATFTNEGPSTAQTVTRTVTLPAGATNIFVNGMAYTPTMANTIDFGTATSLTSGTANSFTFSFTPATTATGTQVITSNVTTTTGQGADTAPNTSVITATVAPVADVAATITPGATVPAGTLASAGTPPSFTVNFTNNGPANAAGVVAQVQLPTGLTNVTATNGGVYNATTGIVSYSGLTAITNGASTTSVIKFDAPANGPVMATASVTTTTSEAGQTANDRQTAALPLAPAFDLTTSLSGPASSVAGDLVTLALTTTNNGPSAASTVVQTAQLATGLSNVYVSNGGFYNATASSTTVTYGGVSYTVPAGGVIYPPLASLPSGQTVANTVSFVMPTSGFAPSATVSTTATGETNTANNTAYLNTPASGTATAVTLAPATATGNPANVYTKISSSTAVTTTGSNVTLTVTTGNNGSATSGTGSASGVVQTVQLLPGFTAGTIQVDGQTGTLSGNTITFSNSGATYNTLTGMVTFPSITQASGASVNHTVTFAAPASTGNNGQLLATAMVTSTNVDPVPADNTAATVIDLAPTTDLAATLTGPATATAGQVVTYTATFTNNGGMAASGYNVSGTQTAGVFETAQLPVGLGTVTITDANGNVVTGATYSATTGVVTFPTLTTDAVGATQAYTLSFVAPAQSLVASANVNTASPDGNAANNSASVATTITPAADLTTTVSGPATAAAGNPVNYTLTTTNNGPSPATSVVPTLQLAAGYSLGNILVANQAGTLSGNVITFPNGATYNTTTGLVTLTTTASLASGASLLNRVTVIMPSAPTGGQLSAVSSVTSATTDVNPGNNSSSAATSVAPATTTNADLVATVSATPTSVNSGDALTLTATFTNNGPDPATNVVPTMQLPAGLTVGTISNGGVYNATTGLVTWPTVSSLASGTANALTYTVSLTAPAVSPLVAVVGASSDTSEPNNATALANNTARLSIVVNPVFDEVTRLGGPASALAGTSQTYTATAINNGPSATANATTQTVTLPAGLVPTNITNGGTYSSSTNTITWTIPAGQAAGTAGAVANSFTVVQPTGGLSLTANVTVTGESNTTNNSATLTTTVPNQPPTAAAVINSLQSPEGNTAANSVNAPYGMLISPLAGSDPEGALSTTAPYTVATIPTTTQGTLYYNTSGTTYAAVTAGQPLTAAQAASLRFLPAAGYVGNANFTYLATDAASNQPAPANYTIPVGTDAAATYATYNGAKGGTNKYVTGDVLAQAVDPNASRYNAAGGLYDAQGNQLATTANGIGNAVVTNGSLPTGVSIDPNTGRIYVSDATLLVNNTTARTYTVTVTTTDANGGVSVVPVTFTIGAYPLPVVLTEFTAVALLNRDALLNWATASEASNDHFDIERSFDGTSFVKIGQLAGHGTTTTKSVYTLTDANVAAKATGPVYYRLRQVDLDGSATYSPVRTVSFTSGAAPVALSLYPNPAQASTTLELSQLPATGTYQVQLLDATGRTVRAVSLGGGLPQPLDISDLATGSYHVLVTGQLADGSAFKQTLRLTKE